MCVASALCGACQKKRSVVSTRSRAWSRVIQPRSTPIVYEVSANPTAATLEKLFVGQRSGASPLRGLAVSQKKSNVFFESVSRKALSLAVGRKVDAGETPAGAAAGAAAGEVGVADRHASRTPRLSTTSDARK